ncbi:MAG: hypothetical protein QNK30_01220 [Bacteroidales bacterium]|nr:hypothetical protein [Bacteroidales bacterium]
MYPLIHKLNFKDQPEVLILNSPDDFMQVLKEFENLAKVDQKIQPNKYEFILIFVKNLIEIKEVAIKIPSIMADDVTLWIAYPKKSSKKYTSDISRDNGWQPLGDLGFEGVRQIAIDEDWSALRFRQAKYIKSLKRDKTMVMSKEGKQKLNS